MRTYFRNRARAFGFAFAGLFSAFRNEAHLKLHGLAALAVIAIACYFSVSAAEWLLLLGCITLVICLELVNSALERLCNRITTGQDPAIKYIKDVAAAAVLVACVFSVIVGVMVFKPYVTGFI